MRSQVDWSRARFALCKYFRLGLSLPLAGFDVAAPTTTTALLIGSAGAGMDHRHCVVRDYNRLLTVINCGCHRSRGPQNTQCMQAESNAESVGLKKQQVKHEICALDFPLIVGNTFFPKLAFSQICKEKWGKTLKTCLRIPFMIECVQSSHACK